MQAVKPLCPRDPSVPVWQQISSLFRSEEDCLASFLAYEAAEVIDGVKPANLVNLSDRAQPCGRNMFRLWEKSGAQLLARSGIETKTLRLRKDNRLLFIFRRCAIEELLTRPSVQALLRRSGYRQGATVDEVLCQLECRVSAESFPHEIGLFLGYPLKDVAAFMGLAPLPFSCQGPWKIYGNPQPSLHLASRHRKSRHRMVRRLTATSHPQLCLLNRPARRRASILAA